MKQLILPLVLLGSLLLITGCGPSPEAAAQQVCDCIDKFKNSQSLSQAAGNTAECSQLQQKYARKFEGEDLNRYVTKTTECMVGGLLK